MKRTLIGLSLISIMTSSFASERFQPGKGIEAECITDQKTHLIWAKSPPVDKYTWDEANKFIKSFKLCGYTSWRLPSKEEQIVLESNAHDYAPFAWFNTHGFNNIQTDFYWSANEYTESKDSAWGIFMYSGKVYNEVKTGKNYIWPVHN